MDILKIKKILENYKPTIRTTFFVKEIGIFGSFTRSEQNITSDVDVLVSFQKGHKDFFNYMRLKYYLEDLIGIKVDLVMKDALKSRLKEKVLNEVEYV